MVVKVLCPVPVVEAVIPVVVEMEGHEKAIQDSKFMTASRVVARESMQSLSFKSNSCKFVKIVKTFSSMY